MQTLRTYPDAMAPTIAIPSAADLPLPLGATSATMLSSVLSRIVSRKIETAFPWSTNKLKILNKNSTPEGQ